MKNLTLTQAQKRRINGLQKAYLQAKALYETIEEITKEIQQKILLEGNYIICNEVWNMENHRGKENRRITRPVDTYLIDEEIFLNDFLEKCYTEYIKAGIESSKGKEYIPSAEARELMKQAEKELVNMAIEIMPESKEKQTLELNKLHWKYRPMILDIIMKLDCEKIEL